MEYDSIIDENVLRGKMFINRHIVSFIKRMSTQFKILLITGSRQVGKSTLLRETFLPNYDYAVLDDYTELEIALKDPALFFKNHKLPLVIDEVQRAPNVFLQIKLIADSSDEKGIIILTGSQSYKLLSAAADSLAGRICIIEMPALSLREKFEVGFYTEFLPTEEYIKERSKKIKSYASLWNHIFRGSFPELSASSIEWEPFFRSYVRTYIDRDVAEFVNVKNLVKFNIFMKCLAARTGELYNAEAVSRDVGLSLKTIQEWTSILESSGIIKFIHPYANNITNRNIKTPKIYFMDTGLVCYLVGWTNENVAMNGAMSGALFETFIVSEVIKSYYNAGHDIDKIYFYRDKDKKEIDLVIEKDETLYPIEIKKTAHPTIEMAKSFGVLSKINGKNVGHGCIICQCEKKFELSDDVTALPVEFI